MFKKLLFSISVIAVLAFGVPAQSKNSQGPAQVKRLNSLEAELTQFLESDDETPDPLSRPRIVKTKTAGVKASVVVNTAALEQIAFDTLNEKRAENGLSSLKWSDKLAAVARIHSQNMAEFNFFSHRGLDGKMVSDRADAEKLGTWRSIGENIAFNRGYDDPVAKAVELWLDSPTHRQNLMDANWRETAIGVAVADDGSYYFTQVFLRK